MQWSLLRAWLCARLDVKSERGANLVEYVLILIFIALVVILVVSQLGGKVSDKFSQASQSLQ